MATPTLVQHTSSAYHRLGTGDDSVNGMKFTLPNAVLAGNCLIVGITYPYSVSRTISLADTNGTWGSPAITTSDTTLGVSMSIFVLPNATAGIHTITVTFDTALVPVQYRASEFYNVATATPVDGSHGNAAATAPNVDAGSLSVSTNNDANGGHLVWAMFADRDFPAVAATAMTGFTPGSSFSLLDADRIPLNTPIISMPNASEYRVVSTFATFPITPGITASGHTDDYIGCAVALKAAAAGTAPAAGIRIIRVLHQSHDSPPASFAMQAPMDGNLMVLVTSEQQTVVVSGVVDNYSNTYTQYEDSDTSVPQFWVAKNVTPHNDLTITISQTGSAGRSYTLYDITGADTTSPVDGTAHTTAFTNSTGANITDTPVLTPASANGLTIAAGSNGLGPTSGLDTGAPAGAVFDFVYYTSETDNSNMDNADMRAHVYNSDLSTQHWNWVTANGSQSTSQSAMAVHFKVAVASTPATSHEPLGCFDPQQIVKAWFDEELIATRGWFDVELLGPVTVYETKGAFSAELIVKGWFDEELIATRNWFDVELPVPQGSGVSLAGAISGAGAVAAQLTLAEALAAYVTGQAAPTGKLSLAESLAGNLSGQATLAGALSLAEALAGSVAGTAAASGSLVEAIALQGALTGASAARGSLSEAVALQGSLAGLSALTGLLSESVALQGVLTGDSALTGNLGTGSSPALAGAIAGASALTGSLAEAIALQAALAGGSTLPGSLALAEALQGVVVGSAAVSAPLSLAEALQAIVAGTAASPSATLSIAVSLQGILAGTTSATGDLSTPGVTALAGIIAGSSASSASMSETVLLRGAFAASASLTGLTSDLRSIAGVISGAGKSSGALALGLQLSGAIQCAGVGTVGTLLEVVRLQGALASASALSALISAFDPNTVGPALAGRQDLTGLRGVADLNSLAGIQTLGSLKGKVT